MSRLLKLPRLHGKNYLCKHCVEEFSKAQKRTREEEEHLVAKKTPMAKVEKRQRQEEDAKERMRSAEREYRQKIDLANQKQNEMTDKTSHTAKELQVRLNKGPKS